MLNSLEKEWDEAFLCKKGYEVLSRHEPAIPGYPPRKGYGILLFENYGQGHVTLDVVCFFEVQKTHVTSEE